MKINKIQLLGGASFYGQGLGLMTRGPLVTRGPDDANAGGGSQDNQGGNAGTGGNESVQQNNSGTGFNPEAFWQEPKPAASGSPSGGSADSGGAGQGQQQQQPDGAQTARELTTRIDALPFGEVFTQEVVEQLSNGDVKGANQAIQTQLRDATRQSLALSAQLIQQHVVPALQAQMKSMIQEALGTRDNADTLLKEFPSAKDPAVRPMIQGVFDQALKLSGGDRVKAVEATKEMLRHMGKTAATDMDINLPPTNPADTFTTANSSRLVDELLGRTS